MTPPVAQSVDVSISMSIHLGDMLRETAHLSVAEMGAHMRLAMAAWARGGYLDGNPERLRRLAGVDAADWPTIWEALGELWTKGEDGRVYHSRTLAELERAREKKARYQANGKQGGRPSKAKGQPNQNLEESLALAGTKAGENTPPPPPPPDPQTQTEGDARVGGGVEELPGAYQWYGVFKASYWRTTGRQYGHGESDAKAMARFGDLLRSLPEEQRREDWRRREKLIGDFLASKDRSTVAAGWPFSFFVASFRGLALGEDGAKSGSRVFGVSPEAKENLKAKLLGGKQ